MPSGYWIFLLLLLLPAVIWAQSGDRDSDMECRVNCISHIMTDTSSLTCNPVGGSIDNEDDEDDEADGVEKITACYSDLDSMTLNCQNNSGDTINFQGLSPVVVLNVTIDCKKGGKITKMIDLKKIVKPRTPEVWNVTFDKKINKAVIRIRTPYHRDYLAVKKQLFQLFIWSANGDTTQNMSSSDHMKIGMEHFQKNMEYQVKVRAIPQETYLQGTWSEWSESYSFVVPAVQQPEERWETYTLTVCLILLAVLTSSAILFWKNEIFTYMWPSIPHPKHTLVQICNPNDGLLLNVKPEVFSALRVYPMETTERHPCEETEPSIAAAASKGKRSNLPCSTQNSDCSRSTTSVSTEELELSGLLSRSSSDGEDSLQSTSPSTINVVQLEEGPHTPQIGHGSEGNKAEVFGVSKQDEAYVTMSSFYQIK